MSAKLLKQAKKLLSEDVDESIEILKRVIKKEPGNCVALLLLSKAYINNDEKESAEKCLSKVLELEPANLVAWKGYYGLVKQTDNAQYFFAKTLEYAEQLAQQNESLDVIVSSIKAFVSKNKSTSEFLETYYSSIAPGTGLGDLCGAQIADPVLTMKELLRLKLEKEDREIKKECDKIRLKNNKSVAAAKTKEFLWSYYQASNAEDLYVSLINVTNDDDDRKKLEEDLLKYKYNILVNIPNKTEFDEQKSARAEELLDMVNGLVVIKHPSIYVWKLYFDLNDFADLTTIDQDYLLNFIKLFYGTGLATVVLAFAMSDISPFDQKQFVELRKEMDSKKSKSKTRNRRGRKFTNKEGGSSELAKLADKEDSPGFFSNDETLLLMLDAFHQCKDTIFANRLVLLYYMYLKEFEPALTVCQKGIDLLLQKTQATSLKLDGTRKEFMGKLAFIYIFLEPPKYFPAARKLYAKILQEDPKSYDGRVGSAILLKEDEQYLEAEKILKELVGESPNFDAVFELASCEICLGYHEAGRERLLQLFKNTLGTSRRLYERKCDILCLVAQSYLEEASESEDDEQKLSDLVSEAHDYAMQSLKLNRNNAASYTVLGKLYAQYLDNEGKALKCFYKAFELSASELEAARYLVTDFTQKREWEVAEVLCLRIVSVEKVRRKLLTLKYDKSWPYRVLGVASLEAQKLDKAVEWFQSAIRLSGDDLESWVGLGEAYLSFGRLESAIKVFNKALNIDSKHWHSRYFLGIAQYRIKEFDASIQTLLSLLNERPQEECILIALYEAYIGSSVDYFEGGFLGRSVEMSLKAFDIITEAAKLNMNSLKLWKAVGDMIQQFLRVQSRAAQFPFDKVMKLIQLKGDDLTQMAVHDGVTLDSFAQLIKDNEDDLTDSGTKHCKLLCMLLVLVTKIELNAVSQKAVKPLRANSWFNLGLSQLQAFMITGEKKFREAAIESAQHAIPLEPNEADYWILLGIATVSLNPRVSQHCFIKASALDSKNGEIWTNLAVLYLRYGDVELSQQTFLKAQSVNPNLAHSWVGDALVAQASGDSQNAARLFTHAYVLSKGRSSLAQLLYGLSVCSTRIGKKDDPQDLFAGQEWQTAEVALTNYLSKIPTDELALSIYCDILERNGDYERGIEVSEKLCSIFEAQYESSESETVLLKFAQAKSHLARFCLGMQKFHQAVENCEFVMDIVGDFDSETAKKVILSSRTVLGLSYYFLEQYSMAIDEFKQVLQSTSGDNNSFLILISQALYGLNTDDTKQAAIEELLEDIGEHGTSLETLFALAAIVIIEKDESLLPVVKEELESLSLNQLILDSFRQVPRLINIISGRMGELNETSAKMQWQRHAMFFPNDHKIWANLDNKLASKIASTGQSATSAYELGQIYKNTEEWRLVQRSMIFSPSVELLHDFQKI